MLLMRVMYCSACIEKHKGYYIQSNASLNPISLENQPNNRRQTRQHPNNPTSPHTNRPIRTPRAPTTSTIPITPSASPRNSLGDPINRRRVNLRRHPSCTQTRGTGFLELGARSRRVRERHELDVRVTLHQAGETLDKVAKVVD